MPEDPRTGGPKDSASEGQDPKADGKAQVGRGPDQEGLTDYWDDILGPRPETIEQRLVRELGLPHPGTFTLATNTGRRIVSIDPNGKVTLGEGITVDEAAEQFWTTMALKRVGMEQRLQHLAITEAMLIRMGRADLNNEQAAVRAGARDATDHDRAIAERAHMNLQAIVHQVMDFARGLAQRPPQAAPGVPAAPAPAPRRPGDPDCATCHGEGTVLGDCGDSPNVWFDPCPACRPDPDCVTCGGDGMVDRDGDIRGLWRAPCPACRRVDRTPQTT